MDVCGQEHFEEFLLLLEQFIARLDGAEELKHCVDASRVPRQTYTRSIFFTKVTWAVLCQPHVVWGIV